MKELEFIETIKRTLSKNSYLGDDCAYLKDLGIVITQDSLVEDIHFSCKFSSPYLIGYKSIVVNISDILASGAILKYVTIALSLPNYVDENFVKDFYRACEDLSKVFGFEVVGGDITGGEKIFVSVCAIGITKSRNISSRSYAKVGDYVVTTGYHGSSAAGLWLFSQNNKIYPDLCKSHVMPSINSEFSDEIASKINRNYAMMDSSDGLADALYKIAQSSNAAISVDFDKIPYDKDIEKVAEEAGLDFRDWVLYGGEDFQLVACLDKENLSKLDKSTYTIIGQVKEKVDGCFVEVVFEDKIEKICDLKKTYNHFGGVNED